MKAQRGSRGIPLFFLNLRTRRGWLVNAMPWARAPVPIVWKAGWALGLVWITAETHALLGFLPQTIQPMASCHTDYLTPILSNGIIN